MSEDLIFSKFAEKKTKYQEAYHYIKALVENENDDIANLANTSAILKEIFRYFWVGFYLVHDNQLVLGPFQGTVACTRIAFGKGVCGKSWEKQETVIVPNVELFEGHIACSFLSKSEIVVPMIKNNQVIGVLDIDSENYNTFDAIDKEWLEKIVQLLIY